MDKLEKKEYNKFSGDLWDGFEVLSKHSSNEIQFCKDMIKFFKKRREIEEEYSKNLEKLSKKIEYVTPHGSIASAWQAILSETTNSAALHANFVNQINEKVVESFQALVKELDAQRKQLVSEGNTLNSEYSSSMEALKKAKYNYEKACKEAEIAKLTHEKAKIDPLTKQKELPKFEKESLKKNNEATIRDDYYKKQVEETNNLMELYFSEKMPKVLSEFEHFESVRVQMVKNNMKNYVRILQDIPPALITESNNLSQAVEKVNLDSDIDLFVSQNKTHQEIPDVFEYEPYQQGNQVARTKPADKIKSFIREKVVNKDKVETNPSLLNSSNLPSPVLSPVAKPKTVLFGISLLEVMEKQKDKFPNSEIPHILEVLVDAVFVMDGKKTEGIFRIPASGPELNLLKDKIDHGNYEIVSNCVQVHTPCAMIKLWLRELPDPIIPSNLYDLATENPEKALELMDSLPPLNQKIISYIIHFLQELSKPDVVDFTKMSPDNLAMCLAPSFLRCPYQDYNRFLSSTDKQKIFILELMNKLPPSTKPFWSSKDVAPLNAPNTIEVPSTVSTEEPPPIPEFPVDRLDNHVEHK